jgi:pimeloyl-ACP methyl ester carboxylesterase|eukprot:jgi/Chrpa1/15605/Chrysochromulina_OHIO_Genome00021339-RA
MVAQGRRVAIAASLASALMQPRIAQAWCGAPYPPYAYSLPWFQFGADGADVRVVGDFGQEKAKGLSPLLCIPSPGLTYEYLETLEALTISERRVAFVTLRSPTSAEAIGRQATAALRSLEAPRVHVLGHGTGAAAALLLQALEPTRVKSLILASPLATIESAVPAAREALEASLLPLLQTAATTTARSCVEAELARAHTPAAAAVLRDRGLPPFEELLRALATTSAPPPPLLLTRGSRDVSSEATALTILQAVAGARLATFVGSGAMAHVDQRAEYNERLLTFLDLVDGKTTRRAIMLPGTMRPGGSIVDSTVGVE